MTPHQYRCWVEIDRSALRHNAGLIRARLGPKIEIIAVVKANAYGHGLTGCAEALGDHVDYFGVANVEEAMTLRNAVKHPIIILGPALPQERAAIAGAGFIPSISTWEEAEDFSRIAPATGVAINFKIDSGMGRMGSLARDAVALFRRVVALPNITIHSVSTHLPVSNEDPTFTREQLRNFASLVTQLRREVPGVYKVHALQTAGLLAFGQESFDIVRPGILLYGISPLPEFQRELRPVMTWKTRVVLVRDMPAGHGISYGRTFLTSRPVRVATLAAGYADGYPRHLSNTGASLLVRGRRCPLLGRVTMDLMMIDVSDVPDVELGDEVVLMGRQDDEEISCAELAERAGTITWEITTRIGSRVRGAFV
ncbi:MAG: alanine racemase [Chthoniobacterales bacterium]|nr:MAG: alanine racemase [Chthoniobacterales bacterium]